MAEAADKLGLALDLDQEEDIQTHEKTDELTIEKSITEKVGIVVEVDHDQDGDKAGTIGIAIHFADSLEVQ